MLSVVQQILVGTTTMSFRAAACAVVLDERLTAKVTVQATQGGQIVPASLLGAR